LTKQPERGDGELHNVVRIGLGRAARYKAK